MSLKQFEVTLEKIRSGKYAYISQYGDYYFTPMECEEMAILEDFSKMKRINRTREQKMDRNDIYNTHKLLIPKLK